MKREERIDNYIENEELEHLIKLAARTLKTYTLHELLDCAVEITKKNIIITRRIQGKEECFAMTIPDNEKEEIAAAIAAIKEGIKILENHDIYVGKI